MNKTRPLSDNERAYRLFEKFYPPVIQFVLQYPSRIKEDQLSTSIGVLRKQVKELRLQIGENYFYEKDYPLTIETINSPTFTGYNWDELDCWKQSILFIKPIEIFLIHGKTDDFLFFRVHHSLMDGMGLLQFVKAVFNHVNGKSLALPNCFVSDQNFIKKFIRRKREFSFWFNQKLRQNGKDWVGFICRRLYSQNISHGLLYKICCVLQECYSNSPVRFCIPSSVRFLEPNLRSWGNLTLPLYIDVTEQEIWSDVYKKIFQCHTERQMCSKQNVRYPFLHLPVWLVRGILKSLQNFQQKSGRFLTAGMITSVGRVNLMDYVLGECIPVSAFIIPLYQPLFPLSICLTEQGKNCEILLCTDLKVFPEDLLHQVMEKLVTLS